MQKTNLLRSRILLEGFLSGSTYNACPCVIIFTVKITKNLSGSTYNVCPCVIIFTLIFHLILNFKSRVVLSIIVYGLKLQDVIQLHLT